MRTALIAAAVLVLGAGIAAPLAFAQAPKQGPGWFIPGAAHQPTPPRAVVHPVLPEQAKQAAPSAAAAEQPIPQLPPLPKGPAAPAAVMGVLSVPNVYRQSTAVQGIEKAIGARRKALNEAAKKEQAVWRKMQDALAHDRSKLSAGQIRAREKALQQRITKAQKEFSGRNQQTEEAARAAIAKVNRMLIAVIRQVAESRGMNLVLHREQVALNMDSFDITDAVAKSLNKVLPKVSVPPDSAMPIGPTASRNEERSAAAPVAPLPVPPVPASDGPKR
ncbi:MAG: OmpH family outer membrane protein [Acetobacteraceae bacterium]